MDNSLTESEHNSLSQHVSKFGMDINNYRVS